MAQLIKLQDYITRYEWDTFRYPTQYIRLKRDNWERLYERWVAPDTEEIPEEATDLKENSTVFRKLREKLRKKHVYTETLQEETAEEGEELPATKQQLKQQFLDNLLNFQMKWATSTVTHQSIVDKRFYRDSLLKYLLQRFPDTYLLMYHPIFTVKQAPMEGDILFISPVGIEIIHFIEAEEEAVIMAGEERTWHIESPRGNRKILNPLISLKRTEKLVKSILAANDHSFAVKKTVLSRTNSILYTSEPYQTSIIGKIEYNEWFEEKRSLRSPLKNAQIKAAELLLSYCQSTSIRRPEWEEEGQKDTEEL